MKNLYIVTCLTVYLRTVKHAFCRNNLCLPYISQFKLRETYLRKSFLHIKNLKCTENKFKNDVVKSPKELKRDFQS